MRDKNVSCIYLAFYLLSRISHFFYLASRIFIAYLPPEFFSSLIKSHLECHLQAFVATCRIYGFVTHLYFYCHFQTGSKNCIIAIMW